MYRKTNNYRHNGIRKTFTKKKPRRVGFTVATSYLEISDWKALADVAENIIFDIQVRTGCRREHIDWHVSDVAGEIEITFTPFRTNIELLRKQLQTKYAEYTFTVTFDSAEPVNNFKDEEDEK